MLRLTRGDTADYEFTRKACDGSVITTVAQEVTFTMRQTPTSPVLIQKKLSEGKITFNTTNHTYHIAMDHDDTAALAVGVYGFDIQVEDTDDNNTEYVATIAVDKIKITADYTYEEVSA